MVKWISAILLYIVIFSACVQVADNLKGTESDPKVVLLNKSSDLNGAALNNVEEGRHGFNQKVVVVSGRVLKNVHFDFPITVNTRVEYWIQYFCGRGRAYFEKYLLRSDYYAPYIHHLLKDYGLPGDLVYLAMIESGFNNFARSHARAVGPWQFIAPTAERYGLTINWWIDERRDIRKSTLAAAKYLKTLYDMFQSWELAAAAYNAGESKIARAIRRYDTKDFWLLARHKFLRAETRDYVPKIIAAAMIAKNREVFGFPAARIPEAIAEEGIDSGVLATEAQEEEVPLRRLGLTPESSEEIAEAESDEFLEDDRMQVARELVAVESETLLDESPALVNGSPVLSPTIIATPHVLKSGEVGHEHLVETELHSPADLFYVAQSAGISYETLKGYNPEILRWCTPPNLKTFLIKLPASAKKRFLATYYQAKMPKKASFYTFVVKKSDTLVRIARQFGIRIDPIIELNRLSRHAKLSKGTKLFLPIPEGFSKSYAFLELKDPPQKRSPATQRKRLHLRRKKSSL
jgi:hypothetical protein